jgi:hypothetical protein
MTIFVVVFVGAVTWWRYDSTPAVPGLIIVGSALFFTAVTVLVYRFKR